MEALLAAGKIIAGITLTTLLNKTLSLFRIRQLYLSYDDILECFEENVIGHTASLKIYNRGKDKEKSLSIIFPKKTSVQLLSTNYPCATATGNTIKVDRLLSGQTISFTIFLHSSDSTNIRTKPLIQSEDTNGHVFYNRGNVPPSLGPIIWLASIILAFFLTFMYLVATDKNPFIIYSNWKNSELIEQGILPPYGGGDLVSQRENSDEPYPIKPLTPKYGPNSISLPFQIYNTTKEVLKLNIGYQHPKKEFWDDMSALNKSPSGTDFFSATTSFWNKYGFEGRPETLELEIAPKQSQTVTVSRNIIKTSTIENLNLSFRFEGILPTGESFSDNYDFMPEKSRFSTELNEHIESIRQTQKSK